MRYSRLLLIFPEYKNTHFGANHPPAGLGYLSEVLQANDIEHEIVDMRLNPGRKYLIKKIREFKPDLIGVSLMTLLYRQNYRLLDDIKRDFPHIAISAGGPHISTFREKALLQCPSLDYGVTLEGEMTLLELCLGKDLATIKGLLYRKDNEVVYTGPRDFMADLDRLPFPSYTKFRIDQYVTDEIPVLSSRGCPYQCIYCPVKTAIGKVFRRRNYLHVADEIEYWYRQGKRRFGFLDDNFMMDRRRIMDICAEIEKRGLTGLHLRCPNGVRADHCDREILERMKQAGFEYIAFGVEGGNDKVLAAIRKGEKIESVKRAIREACELGYEVALFFIIGSPGETRKDIDDSVKLAQTYPVFDAKFYNLIPFPDTELFQWAERYGYFVVDPDVYLNDASHWDGKPLFTTPELSYAERQSALRYTSGIRRQVRKRAMAQRLRKFGLFSAPLAEIFVNDAIQNVLQHNRVLRRISLAAYQFIKQ
jgi:radical SAM superfamily enzyme YgiQ (UPF0313 family)